MNSKLLASQFPSTVHWSEKGELQKPYRAFVKYKHVWEVEACSNWSTELYFI